MKGSGASLPPSRVGKVQISGYFHPDIKRSLRMVQAATNQTFETLLTQALNNLFREHGVPVFDQDREQAGPKDLMPKETTPAA